MGLIRFYLAISVAVWHISDGWEAMINGYLAVIFFYMISGYYMSMVLNDTYRGPGSTCRFYFARYLRLYPAYLIVAVFSILFWRHADPSRLALPAFVSAPFTWLFTSFSNASIFGLDALHLITVELPDQSLPRLIGPGWSLGIELQFYLLAPFLVRRSLKVAVSILVLSLMLRFSMLPLRYDPWRYYFSPSVFCFFFMGHVSHRLGALLQDGALKRRIGLVALVALPGLGYLNGVNVVRDIDRLDTWIFLILSAASLPFVFALTKNWKFDGAIGDLSYPLYLVHQLAFSVVAISLGSSEGVLALGYSWAAFALVLAVLAAIILNVVIERPLEKLRRRVKTQKSAPISIALIPQSVRVTGSDLPVAEKK